MSVSDVLVESVCVTQRVIGPGAVLFLIEKPLAAVHALFGSRAL